MVGELKAMGKESWNRLLFFTFLLVTPAVFSGKLIYETIKIWIFTSYHDTQISLCSAGNIVIDGWLPGYSPVLIRVGTHEVNEVVVPVLREFAPGSPISVPP